MTTGQGTARRCAWCGKVGGWPARCPDPAEDQDLQGACLEVRQWRHEDGDHRRCQADQCAWAAYWLPLLSAAAVEACQASGQPHAVLSTIDGAQPLLLRTFDRIQNAKPYRTQYGRRHGLPVSALHGLVPVLDGAGAYV